MSRKKFVCDDVTKNKVFSHNTFLKNFSYSLKSEVFLHKECLDFLFAIVDFLAFKILYLIKPTLRTNNINLFIELFLQY